VQPALKPLARQRLLHHSVQDAVRDFILDNKLQAGDPLPPETDLARQLGVSRNSVREAVKALESLGILESRRGSGLFVRAFSFAPLLENLHYGLLFDLRELAELLEVRRVLETGLIGSAMAAMPETALAALRDDVTAMKERAGRGEGFEEEDRRFHQILFEPLGNRTVLKLLDTFWLTYREASRHADMRNPDPVSTAKDHAAIYEAVAAGDIEEARTALDQHYAGVARRLARAQAQLNEDGASAAENRT
jgi:DNA-binding FadR family transcriptional regulator